jgi:D-alanyl-D-alanine carboxypeptidase (penicillin-binding protein 5/6)
MLRLPIITALVAAVAIAPPAAAQNFGGELLDQSGRIVQLGADADPLPSVWAKTWIIADAGTGEILAAKRAHKKRAPASTIKTLTALTLLPNLDLDSTTQAKRQAVRMYGSRVGLKRGKTYTIEQLMNAMILPSANDAAVALAQANGGVPRTVREMNALAEKLQAVNTQVRNPSGLDAPGMVSTAYDLALIGRAALADPTLAAFLKRKNAEFPAKGKKMRTIYTNNRLLLSNYRGAVGVKTGYTSRAGRTYIGAAERGGRTLIVVLMGINERSDVAARKLLDWGFANANKVTPIGQLVDPLGAVPAAGEVLVEGGGEEAPTAVASPAMPVASADVIAMPDESGAASDTGVIWLAAAVAALMGGLLLFRARRRVR